jgi:hypothetical protein
MNTGLITMVNEDGEIIGHINKGDRIVREASVTKLKNSTKWGEGWQFVKLFSDNVRALEGKLSAGSMMIMFALAPCVSHRSNLVVNGDGEAMSNGDIQVAAKVSKESTAKFMNELIDNKVLFRGRTGNSYQYFANPYIYCKGNVINDTLETMFKDYPARLKNKAMLVNGTTMITWGEDWSFTKLFTEFFRVADNKFSSGSVAVMFAIAPYVAYETNILCKRGRVKDPLTVDDIHKITGISKKSITKYIDELTEGKILSKDIEGRLIANPYVYCKGGKVTKELKAMFKAYKGEKSIL